MSYTYQDYKFCISVVIFIPKYFIFLNGAISLLHFQFLAYMFELWAYERVNSLNLADFTSQIFLILVFSS